MPSACRLDRRALLFRLQAAREPRHRDAERLEPRAQLARVLLREDFGGRHQRGLVAGVDRLRGGQRRDHRLAAADVALQQALHRVREREVARDLVDDARLRARQRERQRGIEPGGQRIGIARGATRHRGRRARAALLVRALERQLLREQFLELDARPRRMRTVHQRGFVGIDARVVQDAHGLLERRHVERLQVVALDLGRQQLGQRRALHRVLDRLAQVRLRHAGRARIDGREHLRQRRIGFDDAHRRMHHLHPEKAAAHVAAHAQPLADGHLLDLRAVEIEEAQHELLAVVVLDLHDELAARAIRDLVVEHDALGLRDAARQQLADRRERGFVLVAHRQMQHEIDRAREAELRELVDGLHGLVGGRLLLALRAGCAGLARCIARGGAVGIGRGGGRLREPAVGAALRAGTARHGARRRVVHGRRGILRVERIGGIGNGSGGTAW